MASMERLEETTEDVWYKMRRNDLNEQLNLIIKWTVFLNWKLVRILLRYFKTKFTCSLAISSIHGKHLIYVVLSHDLPPMYKSLPPPYMSLSHHFESFAILMIHCLYQVCLHKKWYNTMQWGISGLLLGIFPKMILHLPEFISNQ